MADQDHSQPYGYCQCGCGGKAPIAAATRSAKGWINGQPKRYIHGHHRRGMVSNEVAEKWREEDRGYSTPCWIWLLDHSYDGYGRKWVGNRRIHAHRWAYAERFGPVPDHLHVDHLCCQRDCVNTDHLEVVTPAENIRRRDARKC